MKTVADDTLADAENHPSTTTLITVYLALLLLLAVTVGAGELETGRWALLVASAVATVKVMLIAIYFMHLRYGSLLVWLTAGAGFFFLTILFSLTIADYLTRPIG